MDISKVSVSCIPKEFSDFFFRMHWNPDLALYNNQWSLLEKFFEALG
jgi:hypothetical protein